MRSLLTGMLMFAAVGYTDSDAGKAEGPPIRTPRRAAPRIPPCRAAKPFARRSLRVSSGRPRESEEDRERAADRPNPRTSRSFRARPGDRPL
jgi:hypothetical protein